MKAGIALFAVLAVSCTAAFALECQKVPQYTDELQLACSGNEINILWPNYANPTQYYRCRGEDNPVLVTCPAATPYFSYVMQGCENCENLIPSRPCNTLNLGVNSKCVPIVGITTTTTAAPTTTTTTAAPTTTTTTAAPTTTTTTTTAPTTTTTQTTTTTTTTAAPPNTDIPPPPSPVTQDPNVPTPPTAPPTPPTIVNTPPSVQNPNSV